MKKVLVVIENEVSLDHADYVNYFIRKYEGEVIELTGFRSRTKEEIIKAVSKCTDIAVQTCFVNGSDQQLHGMVKLLAKIPHPINIYIAYLGLGYQNELQEYLINELNPEDILSIARHKIYAMSPDKYESVDENNHVLVDFEPVLAPLYKARAKKAVHAHYLQQYKETARTRTTGRKILVLGCTAHGEAFKNLPIGEEVDELVCHELQTNQDKARGVWIWGNGEPIMLVNDHGFREYKIMTKLNSEQILEEIAKVIDYSKDIHKLSRLKKAGLLHIIEDDEEYPMGKANLICEELKIAKRGNRQNICKILEENLVESE